MKRKLQTTILLFFLALNCVWAQYPTPTHVKQPDGDAWHTGPSGEKTWLGRDYMTRYYEYLKNVPLYKINMFGAHHATFDEGGNHICNAQTHDLAELITYGVRYGDVRINAQFWDQNIQPSWDNTWTFNADHGSFCTQETDGFFKEMQELNIKNHLGNNDIMIIHFKQIFNESDLSNGELYNALSQAIGDTFGNDVIKPSEVPNFNTATLSELRAHGRFIFIHRFAGRENFHHVPESDDLGLIHLNSKFLYQSSDKDASPQHSEYSSTLNTLTNSSTYSKAVKVLDLFEAGGLLPQSGDARTGWYTDRNIFKDWYEQGYSFIGSLDGINWNHHNSEIAMTRGLNANLARVKVPLYALEKNVNAGNPIYLTIQAHDVADKNYNYKLYQWNYLYTNWNESAAMTGLNNTPISERVLRERYYYIVNENSGLRSEVFYVSNSGAPILDTDLKAFWSCDSGFNIGNDEVGVYDGAPVGNPQLGTGKISNAVSLDGSGDYINVPDFHLPGDFTIAAWVQLDGTIDGNDELIGKWQGSFIDFKYAKPRISIDRTSYLSSNVTIDNNWHHVIFTRTGTSTGNIKVYVDGLESGVSAAAMNGNFDIFYFGGVDDSNTQGKIDDLRVYTRAISADEAYKLSGHLGSPPSSSRSANTKLLSVEEDAIINSINLYPNPATDAFSFTIPTEFKQSKVNVNISDISGKVVQTDILQNNNTNELSVKTNTLSNGLYFVKIAIDNTSVTKKLLINR